MTARRAGGGVLAPASVPGAIRAGFRPMRRDGRGKTGSGDRDSCRGGTTMIRRVAAIVFVLALTPALLYAQDPVFTVTAQSADVHKGPSTVTPVIGHVARGAALPVARNLGSWVRIAWPAAPDG